ncbi:uncharacterized protein [Phaseolus vulgaris]|uniref:uncharacterized protein n=1 Tax=Phaseolus vulgaris TaxID=3885 RepID=UPI0035C9A61D
MNAEEGTGTTFHLQKLTLQQLPRLTDVWERNSKGTQSYQNLKVVNCKECENLQTVFPLTLAKNLKKLDELEILFCYKLHEIVRKEEDTAAVFVFPCLTTLHLGYLPELIYFYPQPFTLDFPVLNKLIVWNCPELELFGSANRQSIFFDLKDICNLEVLILDWELTLVLRKKLGEPMDNLKYLHYIRLYFDADENKTPDLPIQILQKMPNLTNMTIQYCSCLELFQTQIPEIVEKSVLTDLKTLQLNKVSKLHSIGSEDSPWLNLICDSEKLQELYIFNCPDLKTWVHSTPSVSFTYVTEMFINGCQELKYLFTLSAVNKLENLEYIKVRDCESMEAIVLKDEGDISEEIKLQQLKRIDLNLLPSLECFYSGNDTMRLPSLMQEFFQAVDKECSDHLELQADPRCKIGLQNKWMANLETLKLQNCTLSYAIPSSILALLKNLKELEVRESDKVKAIFDMNDDTKITATESQLKILTLNGLGELTHVWEKDTHRILIFRNLQEVAVSYCAKLQTLFPAFLAKSLKELKKLQIDSCENLQDFVENEETAFVTEKFVFPKLEDLQLNDLPRVTCPKTFTMEFPSLNFLYVRNCDELELFQSIYDPMGEGTSSSRLPLISDPKVISNLEGLTLDCKQIRALSLWFNSQQSTEGLTNLNSISLLLVGAENEMPTLPIEILKAPNLIEMDIIDCESLENFLAKNPKIGEEEMLGQLTQLTLCNVSTLQFFQFEYSSSLNIICERIHKLLVDECPHFTTLGVHSTSTVSFSCLKEVHIDKCPNLKYLFTSSAAKMLVNLEEISVRECESVTEIVAKEGDATSESIKFERLHAIYLLSLTSLVCFYSGSDTLQLSSLKTVTIWSCPNMKLFSQRIESLMEITLSMDEEAEDLPPPQDLNTSIKGISQRKEFFEAVDKECFSDNLELQEDPHCKFGLQNEWLGDLVTLKLQNCTLPCALPSAILGLLKSLKELEVRDSATVEVLFYMNDTEITEIASQLKILTLKGLSSMTHVWEKKKNGVLIFPNLQRVDVSNCENLQSLFPASLAKNLKSLKGLEIKSCAEFQEVVEKEEDAEAKFLFQSEHCMGKGTLGNRQPLFSSLEVISNLKELDLDWKQVLALRSRLRSEKFTGVFKYINNMFLLLDTDQSEIPMVVNEIVYTASNLTQITMAIPNCNNPEIFLSQNPKIGEDGMLLQLRTLILIQVSAIQSIQSENSSWLNTICEKVHELCVIECPHVETIGVHSTSTMSFSFLKNLHAYECSQLQYLFTSSVAKKLVNLEEIRVQKCKSLKK